METTTNYPTFEEQRATHRKHAAEMNTKRDDLLQQEEFMAKKYLEGVDTATFTEHMKANLEDARLIEQAITRILERGEGPVVLLRGKVNEIVVTKYSHNEYLPIVEHLRPRLEPSLDEYTEIVRRLGLRLPISAVESLKANLTRYHADWKERFVDARTYGDELHSYSTIVQRGN